MAYLRILIAITIFTFAFLIGGCASTPYPPLSDFEQSLYQNEPHKASIVIYRSNKESAIHKPIGASVYIDKQPFVRLKGGEYVQIYLPNGKHKIGFIYHRDCENIKKWERTIALESGEVYYLEVVPGFGGMAWVYCSPLQGVPFPFIGSKIELFMRKEGEAQRNLGEEITKDLMKTRRVHRTTDYDSLPNLER